jgi:hypothetical protein
LPSEGDCDVRYEDEDDRLIAPGRLGCDWASWEEGAMLTCCTSAGLQSAVAVYELGEEGRRTKERLRSELCKTLDGGAPWTGRLAVSRASPAASGLIVDARGAVHVHGTATSSPAQHAVDW